MRKTALTIVVLALAAQAMAAPQFISLGKGGEVGVNFGGYHASAGLGGLLGGAASGGLHAEAGTPHGQAARAGLGGSVGDGGSAGGLYADATAGGGVGAAAGLAGAAGGAGAVGGGYSAAQAGGHSAAAGLGGETSNAGSAGFSFSAHKSVGFAGGAGGGTLVKQVEAAPPVVETVQTVQSPPPHGLSKHKKVTTYEEETVNYVNEVPPPAVLKAVVAPVVKTVQVKTEAPRVHVEKHVRTEAHAPVVYKEVYVPEPVVYYKPRHHHKAWAGGYFEAGGAVPPPTRVVYKEVHAPVVHRRVDVVAESDADAAVGAQAAGDIGYSKRVNFQHRNPTFFADIFNIPIQTLSAVGKFLGNAAGSTSVTVEKSAYAHAG